MFSLFRPHQQYTITPCAASPDLREIEERLKRIETRLCKLVVALGHEDLLHEPAPTRLKKREQSDNIHQHNKE